MAVDTLDLGLPHLTVVDTIGRGGFSVVYKATDTKLNRPVAVKVLTGMADQAGLERFDQECQIHGPLSNHPNIVTIHDAGFTPTGSPFLVMEYLDSGSLTDYLENNGRMPWQKAIEWMAPVCDAVDTAHRMGVLHRDIKPANILVSPDGPKLADFGIACVTDATSPQFAVSWLHAPPEAELNRRDERSDVYSLASTLYQLITGSAPYWRDGDESLAALLTRMATEPVPHLSPAIAPPWVDQLLQRALAKDPAMRPASATEFAAALAAGAGHPNSDDRATEILPTHTEILPAVGPVSTANPVGPVSTANPVGPVSTANPPNGFAAQSRPAGGGPLIVGGPHAFSSDSGSPTIAGRSDSYSDGHTSAAPFAAQANPHGRRGRSKKLPVAAAIVAIATVAFFLSPAWAALQPAPTRGAADTASTTPTTTGDDRTDSTPEAVTETTTDASSTTEDTTDTTDTSDTTEDTDSTDTTEDTPDPTPDTSPITDPPPPPSVDVSVDVEVPNVADLTAEQASQVLTDEGFTDINAVDVSHDSVDAGLVVNTDPAAGSVVDPDDPITLRISSGPSQVTIPDLRGDDPDAAIATLQGLGLEPVVEIVELEAGSSFDGLVTGTFPGPGAEVAVGSTVAVGVGDTPSVSIPTIDAEIVQPTVSIPPTTFGIVVP